MLMKRITWSLMLVGVAVLLGACLNQSGAVSREAVLEMLDSPKLAVTPFQPIWLNEGTEEIWPLSEADRQKVCAILRAGEARHIPELTYQTDDARNPLSEHRFYIYATNGQCLAGTLLENRVAMHDVVLPPEQEALLYVVLKPYLVRVFPGLK